MSKTFVAVLVCLINHVILGSLTADDVGKQPGSPFQKHRIGTSSVQVELREASDSAIFAVSGLPSLDRLKKLPPEDLQKSMMIRVHQPGSANILPALLGTYSLTETELRFTSRFPLSPSVKYRVELAPRLIEGHHDPQAVLFSANPKKRVPAATVSAVYPSADVLPENLLKFYIHFSAPMSRGEAYQRIHLILDGKVVESPFLELGEELWDSDQMRFTLFVHPGRIKRGLKPREDSGTPMTEGKEYALSIDADWMGADLQPLSTSFVKKFRVVRADSRQPDLEKWKIVAPKSNSNQPVTLTFDEPLDHAMLVRVVKIKDASQSEMSGKISVTENETVWSFEPMEPWKPGSYRIWVAATLEDLVGNNLLRPFETVEQESKVIENKAQEVSMEFVVR